MVSKIIALFLAMVLLFSFNVAATRELSETSNSVASKRSEELGVDGPYRCPNGCCGKRRKRDPYCRCCAPNEKPRY
ncbi:hypothetical protein, partial [Pleomorphochaeta sp. DL1XJH-081]|uniref:hypothetical protein n=1 Tax=Pleomorphochaeta sp. DL1XJH-081 TaxID=3409690 RepID=UPI003BB4A1E9